MTRGTQLEDGTPLSVIQQHIFEESQQRHHPAQTQPAPPPPPPPRRPQVHFEEPIPTPVPAMVDMDPVGAIQRSTRVSSYENTEVQQHKKSNVARQMMNSVIVSFVVFLALYIFPFLQSTPVEYRASTMKILVIAIGMGIVVFYIQKSLQ